jgi:dipeptidyl aminopeptidase/acylaminoacyl peptidase
MDNNVHPGNTIRLINALIKANKRFDFMLLPGKPHVYGDMQPYFNRLLMEYFAEHLIGDYYRTGAEIR